MIIKKMAGISLAVFFIAALFFPGYARIRHLKNKNRDLAQKNNRLKAENTLLQTELKRLANDQHYQEKILREKLGVVRKNEIPVKIVTGD
ncbi:MAG: septum formation initiator family protein [Candidatus Omnitrophica bacterium]|jgi:cell division protein FtsB|nr:septum formation initiator family protein [Candidatus Omnitrophota bacterium]